MDYKTILRWLLNAIAIAKENVVPTIEEIEQMLDIAESLAARWGIMLPESQHAELTEDELHLENLLIAELQTDDAAFDMERIRKLLQRAKQLGILEVVMAALVSKIKIPGLPASDAAPVDL